MTRTRGATTLLLSLLAALALLWTPTAMAWGERDYYPPKYPKPTMAPTMRPTVAPTPVPTTAPPPTVAPTAPPTQQPSNPSGVSRPGPSGGGGGGDTGFGEVCTSFESPPTVRRVRDVAAWVIEHPTDFVMYEGQHQLCGPTPSFFDATVTPITGTGPATPSYEAPPAADLAQTEEAPTPVVGVPESVELPPVVVPPPPAEFATPPPELPGREEAVPAPVQVPLALPVTGDGSAYEEGGP